MPQCSVAGDASDLVFCVFVCSRMLSRTTTARPDPDGGHHKHHGGVGFSSSAYLSNVYTHISDPSVFVVPSYCKKDAADTMRGDDQLPTILERFIML